MSLVNNFIKLYNHDSKKMKSVLEESKLPVDNIMGFPVYTFSDGSTIYFDGLIFCTSQRKNNNG